MVMRPFHSSGDKSLASHRGGPGSSPGQVSEICSRQSGAGAGFLRVLGFLCQAFHRLLHTHHTPSSGVGTIDQTVADVPNGPSLTPAPKTKKAW
jgi:hypothetical protein